MQNPHAPGARLPAWDDGSGITEYERAQRQCQRADHILELDGLLGRPSIPFRELVESPERFEEFQWIMEGALFYRSEIADIDAERFFSAKAVQRIEEELDDPSLTETHPEILSGLWRALKGFGKRIVVISSQQKARGRKNGRPVKREFREFLMWVFVYVEEACGAEIRHEQCERIGSTILSLSGQPCPKDMARHSKEARAMSRQKKALRARLKSSFEARRAERDAQVQKVPTPT